MTRHESMELEPFIRLKHGDTEDTESIDSLGESTGKTLRDLRASVLPLLRSEEFDADFLFSATSALSAFLPHFARGSFWKRRDR